VLTADTSDTCRGRHLGWGFVDMVGASDTSLCHDLLPLLLVFSA
jgi:hypothetical protein